MRVLYGLCALILMLAPSLDAQAPDVLYLRFNEGTGTTTADQAIPGVGAAPFLMGAAGWGGTAQAALGNSCLVPGSATGDVVNTGTAINVTGDWTLEFWCYDPFSSFAFPTPLKDAFSDNTLNGLRAYATNNLAGIFDFVFSPTAGTSMYLQGVLPQSTWTHMAFVYDATGLQLKAYIDGVLNSTMPTTAPVPLATTTGASLVIGGNNYDSWVGAIDEFRIWSSARTAAQIAANYNTEVALFTTNISVSSISSPVNPSGVCALAGVAEIVTCDINNGGASALTAGTFIPIQYTIDGGAPVLESALVPAGDLAAGASMSFTFSVPADLSAPGAHTVTITATLLGDQNPADDSASVTIASGGTAPVSSFPWTEDFDNLTSGSTSTPLGWEQETGDSSGSNSDWIFQSGAAPTASTSPIGDHTSGLGLYAYIEDSGANHANVSLRSPCIDLNGLSNPNLAFWFHSQDASAGLNSNPMSIDVVVGPVGTVTMDVFGPEANIGNGWMARNVDLSAFAGQTIQLIFRGRSDGGTAKNDTAIDDVRIYNASTSSGQAPVAGTAVLDLNSALNGNGTGIQSLANGPYFSSALSGGPIVFDFAGEPSQPFALIIGPLNLVAATYPNVGQLDIGGTVDPVTGIPNMIQVLGDGFNPLSFIDLLFNTGPAGNVTMSFQAPTLPPGVIGTFQSMFATSNGFFFAISNAVELTII